MLNVNMTGANEELLTSGRVPTVNGHPLYTDCLAWGIEIVSTDNNDGMYTLEYMGTGTIKWGDGYVEELSATVLTPITHTYTTVATYVIRISGSITRFQAANNDIDRAKVRTLHTMNLPGYTGAGKTTLTGEFYNCINAVMNPNFKLPNSITNLTGTFYGCSSLSVVPDALIPLAYINTISNMFNGCTSLTKAPIIRNVNNLAGTFQNCSSLNITPILPDGYSNTLINTFNGCSSLVTIPNIPDGVTDLTNTFTDCSSILQLPNNLIPAGYTGKLSGTFQNCSSIKTIPVNLIPNGVTVLDFTFAGCSKLEVTPNIPSGVKDLNSTFTDCYKLSTVPTLPTGITILTNTFKNCTNLTTVPTTFIPSTYAGSLYSIFNGCTNLTNAPNIPIGVTDLSYAFNNCTSIVNIGSIWPTNNFSANAINVSHVFNRDTAIANIPTGTLPANRLWANESAATKFSTTTNAFKNCTSIANYADIPSNWGGAGDAYPNYTDCIAYDIEMPSSGNYALKYVGAGSIDWGDGNIENVDSGGSALVSKTHAYSGAGVFTIKINGYIAKFIAGVATSDCLKVTVLHTMNLSGYTGGSTIYTFINCQNAVMNPNFSLPNSITHLSSFFSGCKNIVEIPNNLIPAGYTGDLNSTFFGCSKLKNAPTIPSGVSSLNETFYNCFALKNAPTIPPGVTDLSKMFFGCTELVSPPEIPSGYAGSLSATFAGCTKLTSAPNIPAGVTNLAQTFESCPAIATVTGIWPASFTNTNINIANMFYRSTAVANKPLGTLPHTILWGNPATWSVTESAFKNCTSITDYNQIPESWGGPVGSLPIYPDCIAWDVEVPANTNLTYDIGYVGTGAINWGDGTSDSLPLKTTLTTTSKTLSNPSTTSSRKFTIIITGNTTRIVACNTSGNKTYVKTIHTMSLTNYTGVGKTSTTGEFYGCTNATLSPNFVIGTKVSTLLGTFRGCTKITAMPTIPTSVTNLSYAFYGCTALVTTSIIPNAVNDLTYAFYNCSNLTTAPTIPSVYIGSLSYTFYGCSKITVAPAIPSTVTHMASTFRGCTKLTLPSGFMLPASVSSLSNTFYGCTSVGNISDIWPTFSTGSKSIDHIFYRASVQTGKPSGVLPANKLWDSNVSWSNTTHAFKNCDPLSNYNQIPESWGGPEGAPTYDNCIAYDIQTTSNNEAFELKFIGPVTINWGDTVIETLTSGTFVNKSHTYSTAGTYTIKLTGTITRFQAASNGTDRAKVRTLHTMNLPGYTGVGKDYITGEFYNCTNATLSPNFTIGSSVTTLVGTFSGCTSLTTTPTIPSGYSGSLSYTFANCSGLTTPPTIPSGVTDLSHTFEYCSGLTTPPTIPSGYFGSLYATFANCSGLTTPPTIPSGVTDLSYTFMGCSGLTNIDNVWPVSFTQNNIYIIHIFSRLSLIPGKPTGTLPANLLWAYPDAATKFGNTAGAFKNCTSLTNYGDIPEDWGGPST